MKFILVLIWGIYICIPGVAGRILLAIGLIKDEKRADNFSSNLFILVCVSAVVWFVISKIFK